MFFSTKIVQTKNVKGVSDSYFGLKKDTSDSQWNHFSQNMDLIVIIAIIFLSISNYLKGLKRVKLNNYIELILYYIFFGLAYILYLFRGGAIYWFFFTLLNYKLTNIFYKKRKMIAIVWILNLSTMFCNDLYHGYDLRLIFPFLSDSSIINSIEESRKDALVQWHVVFNMTILRMISYSMDKHWAHH